MPNEEFPELYEERRGQGRRIGDDSPEARARRVSLEGRLVLLETQVGRLMNVEQKLDANTAMTKQIVDLFHTLEAGFRVLAALGRLAKWAAPIVALFATVWSLFHGKPPSEH